MHRCVEAIAIFIDTGRDCGAAPIVHESPFYGVKYMLAMTGTAQAFGDCTEVAYEELLKVSEACLIIFAVPAAFCNLFADFFSVSFKPLYFAKISSVQLSPFC